VELLHERCAGLDIGKKDLKACVRTPNPSGRRSRRQEIRTFATTTNALLELRDWLVAQKVTLVVLEATGARLLAGCVLPVGGLPERDLGQRRACQGPAWA
jgi:transposase